MSKTGLYINLFLQETMGLLLDRILQILRYNIFDNGLNLQKHFLVPISKAVNGKKKCCAGEIYEIQLKIA